MRREGGVGSKGGRGVMKGESDGREREWSGGSGAYHPYHITKAYPIKALCCIASTFSLATFHCIL